MSKNYDVGRAFEVIEDELIRSMIRNFKRHRVSEVDEGIEWEQWQALQLKALDEYKKKNLKYRDEFTSINHKITDTIKDMYRKGQAAEELALFNTFKRETNISVVTTPSIDGGFFKINTGKLEALINATTNDMTKAEHAVLRMVEDKYRSIIFNAQVYANTGAGTYEKAVDMATKDFLAAGINCIEYKNGARHTISNYSRMAIRTANKRAFLQGEGEKRAEWGISTVIINKRQGACPKCAPFVGKVLIDDVWSGGDKEDKRYPLMSFAIKKGLYHPNCLDSHSTYFPGISTADDTWTKEELEEIGYNYNQEQKILYAKNQAEKFHRLAEHSLDKDNQRMYRAREKMWRNVRFKTEGVNSDEYLKPKRLFDDVKSNFEPLPSGEAEKVLERYSLDWITGLTEKQIKSIKKYTYNEPKNGEKVKFFRKLNQVLRTGKGMTRSLQYHIDNISSALKVAVSPNDIKTYRGVNAPVWFDKPIGAPFVLEQFTSTSLFEESAFKYPYKIEFWIHNKTKGVAYIEMLSNFKGQKEVLLDGSCIARVLLRQGNRLIVEVIR